MFTYEVFRFNEYSLHRELGFNVFHMLVWRRVPVVDNVFVSFCNSLLLYLFQSESFDIYWNQYNVLYSEKRQKRRLGLSYEATHRAIAVIVPDVNTRCQSRACLADCEKLSVSDFQQSQGFSCLEVK